jgi:hypothetical protein
MSSVADTAERAAHQVKDTAAHTRASLLDLGAQALRFWNDMRTAELRGVDSVLGRIGLQRRASAPSPIVWFVAGAAVAGVVLFVLAPTQGKKLRERITGALHDRASKKAASATNGAAHAASEPNA